MLDYLRLLYYLLRPNVIFLRRFAHGMGDNLLLAGVLPALRKNNPDKKIVVETERWKDIFLNNPYIDFVTDKHFKTTRRHLKPKYRIFPDSDISLYEMMGSYVNQDSIKPEIYLTEQEKECFSKELNTRYIVVCPAGKKSYSANRKEWGVRNFQEVVNSLKDRIDFVQIGSVKDPLLDFVKDYRGLKIRESAAVMGKARLFLGLEGGLMHLAKAVSIQSVIIYGGMISPGISGYSENINIYEQCDCSPCFTSEKKLDPCGSMKCMKRIKPERVINQISRTLEK